MKATITLLLMILTLTVQASKVSSSDSLNANKEIILNDTICDYTMNIYEDDSVNVFLLMGLTRESGNWGPEFTQSIKKNLPKARIYFLDLPGSGKHNSVKAGSVQDMVEFMRKEVEEVIEKKNRPNYICATSLAGMVATEWTISHKEDFQGLVIINSSFKGICKSSERASLKVKLKMMKVIFKKTNLERESIIVTINSNKPENYDSVALAWADVKNNRPMTKANMFRQTMAGMKYAPEGKPELPLLIIGSKKDRMVCPTCIEKTHETFGGTLIWNETSGHGLPVDEPKWLSETISTWVNYQSEAESLVKK
jgi:pimeloyl-ACP methyl ester carboxylesterase